MKDEYEVLIEDLNPPKKHGKKNIEVSKAIIQRVINENLKNNLLETQKSKGHEIDVTEEWTDLLQKDGSILRDYEDIGWKIMWYNIHSLGPGRGDLVRSWLSFRSEANASKER